MTLQEPRPPVKPGLAAGCQAAAMFRTLDAPRSLPPRTLKVNVSNTRVCHGKPRPCGPRDVQNTNMLPPMGVMSMFPSERVLKTQRWSRFDLNGWPRVRARYQASVSWLSYCL